MASMEEVREQLEALIAERAVKDEAGEHRLSVEDFGSRLREIVDTLSPEATKQVIERALARDLGV